MKINIMLMNEVFLKRKNKFNDDSKEKNEKKIFFLIFMFMNLLDKFCRYQYYMKFVVID